MDERAPALPAGRNFATVSMLEGAQDHIDQLSRTPSRPST